jgi:hypothetical protein
VHGYVLILDANLLILLQGVPPLVEAAVRLSVTSPRFAFAAPACPRCGLFTAILNANCGYAKTPGWVGHPGGVYLFVENTAVINYKHSRPKSETFGQRNSTDSWDEIKHPGVAYLLLSMAFTCQRATRPEPCGSEKSLR